MALHSFERCRHLARLNLVCVLAKWMIERVYEKKAKTQEGRHEADLEHLRQGVLLAVGVGDHVSEDACRTEEEDGPDGCRQCTVGAFKSSAALLLTLQAL